MKELHYPNAVYDAIAAPYVQYTGSSSESDVVGNPNYNYLAMLWKFFTVCYYAGHL